MVRPRSHPAPTATRSVHSSLNWQKRRERPSPEHLARQLALLYDGAQIAARMDQNADAGATAREIAAGLVDAAIRT